MESNIIATKLVHEETLNYMSIEINSLSDKGYVPKGKIRYNKTEDRYFLLMIKYKS